MAMDRLGYNDHGSIHVKIVANGALKMLRLLMENGMEPSIKVNYGMTVEDAEVVVVLASIMHDLGIAFVRESHELFSVPLALDILKRCLSLCYSVEEEIVIMAEVIHAIVSHHASNQPSTIEAGIVKIADALDMEKGRARIPYETGRINIHSISAIAIENVKIIGGGERPITIDIEMSNPAGIFQVDNLLGAKIRESRIEQFVIVNLKIKEGNKTRVVKFEV